MTTITAPPHHDDDAPTALAVGQPYPYQHTAVAGASIQLLDSGSFLQVFLPGMHPLEEEAVNDGTMTAGLIEDGPLLLFVFRFQYGDKSPMVFEGTFDSRIVPEKLNPLQGEIEPETRLLVTVHLVDSASGILKGLRMITLPHAVTQSLPAAMRRQSSQTGSMMPRLAVYQGFPVEKLPDLVTMYPCGE